MNIHTYTNTYVYNTHTGVVGVQTRVNASRWLGTPASNSSCVIVVVHLGGARAPQPVGGALRDGNFKKVVRNTRFKRVFSAIIGKDRTVRERVPTRVIVRGDQRGNNAKGGHDVSAWQPSSVGFLIVNYCRPFVALCSRLYGDITIVKCH